MSMLLLVSACSKFGPEQEKAWDLIEKGALMIDVRTPEEFMDDHLQQAINIEYQKTVQLIGAIGSDTNRSVVLYCRSGSRASLALSKLTKRGYTNIYNAQSLSAMQAALEYKSTNINK